MTYDSRADTYEHIQTVEKYLHTVVVLLLERGRLHDQSKLVPPEKDAFDIATPKLKTLTYGTEEYRTSLADMRPAIEHHYSVNRHHPEYNDNGINGMNLLDVIEMLCDWKAASERSNKNHFMQGLDYNKKRFEIDDQMFDVIKNTAIALGFDVA